MTVTARRRTRQRRILGPSSARAPAVVGPRREPAPAYALLPGHEFFASSANGTTWPGHLTEVGASAGSIALGWLGPRIGVSGRFGNRKIWPGDTFGIAALPRGPATRLALSWGSAVGGNKNSEIYAAVVTPPAAR